MKSPRLLLALTLLLAHLALWPVPLARSLRFHARASASAGHYAEPDGGLNLADLSYARWLVGSYTAAATVALAYAAAAIFSCSRAILLLFALQAFLPLWLVWRRPESAVGSLLPFSAAHLLAAAVALGFGAYLVHPLTTPEPDTRAI